MSTRYIVDAEGRPVEAIMKLDDLRQVLEAQRQAAEVLARVERAVRDLANARPHVGGIYSAARATEQYRRDLRAIEDAQKTLSTFVGSLEELEDREEELEAIRAFDQDIEKIERNKAELIPWEESKRQRRELR